MMAVQRETVGMAPAGRPKIGFQSNPIISPTLSESGIEKNLAERARKMAAVPQKDFDSMVEEWRGNVEQENQRVTDIIARRREAERREVRSAIRELRRLMGMVE